MSGLRALGRALLAGHYRARARRILARVDRLLDKANGFKRQAARLEAEDAEARSGHRPRDGP